MNAILLTLCLLPAPTEGSPFRDDNREIIRWNGRTVSTVCRGGYEWVYADGRDYVREINPWYWPCGPWREWPPREALEVRR